MQVVHLPTVRNHLDAVYQRHVTNFLRFGKAPHPVGIELENIQRTRLQQIMKAIARVLMLPTRQRNVGVLFEFGEILNFVGQHVVLQPSAGCRVPALSEVVWRKGN